MSYKYYSPSGNLEVWSEKPEGYFTLEQWREMNPPEAPQPDPEAERLSRIMAIKDDLNRIDNASIRPLRTIDNGTDTEEDHRKLMELEARAVALRAELAGLDERE